MFAQPLITAPQPTNTVVAELHDRLADLRVDRMHTQYFRLGPGHRRALGFAAERRPGGRHLRTKRDAIQFVRRESQDGLFAIVFIPEGLEFKFR